MLVEPRSPARLTPSRQRAVFASRLLLWISRHWLAIFLLFFGIYIALPWLAPVLMKLGARSPAQILYWFYALECHQFPQRAYYLFGEKTMYSLAEIQTAWQPTRNPLILRQFIGTEQMGYKVAWCDRTTAMYGAIWLFMGLGPLLLRRLRPLPLWAFALLTVPVLVDGGTHMVSDLAGLGLGFRETNAWLASMTAHAFPAPFYATDIVGSFNWWMRLLTGSLFGLGVVWLAYPALQSYFSDVALRLKVKFASAGIS